MTVFGIYALTLPNIDRFSQLFHCQNQEKICNNPITKDLSHHTSSVSLHYLVKCQCLKSNNNTRMVQLPATAAIEYVAAGHFFPGGRSFGRGIFGRGCFCPGGLLPGWTFVRGAYARSPPQVQCIYALSRLSVPSIVAWRTNKNKKRQTRPRSSAGSRPPLPKLSGYVEVEAHYIFHPSTIWVRPPFTELGPKKPKKPILPWSKRIYVALVAI